MPSARRSLWSLAPLAAAWAAGVIIMVLVSTQPAARAGEMLMDPTFRVGTKWYTGLVSNLGVLAWAVAAAAAFAGVWLCRLGGRRRAAKFLLGGGVVGTVLVLDDLFQFHAILLPSELGIPKLIGQALIGAALGAWALGHTTEIRRTRTGLLFAVGAMMVMSYVIDSVYAPAPGAGWSILEDGAKFLGALAWATYFVVTTRDICRSVFTQALMTWPDDAYDAVFLKDVDVAVEADPQTDVPADVGSVSSPSSPG